VQTCLFEAPRLLLDGNYRENTAFILCSISRVQTINLIIRHRMQALSGSVQCLCHVALRRRTDTSLQCTLSPQRTHRTGRRRINNRLISAIRNLDGRMCRLPQEEHFKTSHRSLTTSVYWLARMRIRAFQSAFHHFKSTARSGSGSADSFRRGSSDEYGIGLGVTDAWWPCSTPDSACMGCQSDAVTSPHVRK
jgi:hypothetical protein